MYPAASSCHPLTVPSLAPAAISDEPAWRCSSCPAAVTPQRRFGPRGPGTLCNACGLKWGKARAVPRRHLDPFRPRRDLRMSIDFLLNDPPALGRKRRRRPAARLAAAEALLHFVQYRPVGPSC